jgi:hypothetical protein
MKSKAEELAAEELALRNFLAKHPLKYNHVIREQPWGILTRKLVGEEQIAAAEAFVAVINAYQSDDLEEHRRGRKALEEFSASVLAIQAEMEGHQ